MPVPKIKYENLHRFIFGAVLWLTAVYVVIEIFIFIAAHVLSLVFLLLR